jgi:hypothetical protein
LITSSSRAVRVAAKLLSEPAVPKISWSAFIDRLPVAHLLIGVVPEGRTARPEHRAQLLARLFGRLGLKGFYAITISKQRPVKIRCAFELEVDARKVGDALQAKRARGNLRWRTQRVFTLGFAAAKALEATLWRMGH